MGTWRGGGNSAEGAGGENSIGVSAKTHAVIPGAEPESRIRSVPAETVKTISHRDT